MRGADLEQLRYRLRRPHDVEMLQRFGKIVPGQSGDAPSKDAVQSLAGAVALIGLERMAGDAGAKHLRARIAGKGGERIFDATACDGADRLAGFGIPAGSCDPRRR